MVGSDKDVDKEASFDMIEPTQRSGFLIVTKLSTHTWLLITTMTMGLFTVTIIELSVLQGRGHKIDATTLEYASTAFWILCLVLYLWAMISVFRSEAHIGHK